MVPGRGQDGVGFTEDAKNPSLVACNYYQLPIV